MSTHLSNSTNPQHDGDTTHLWRYVTDEVNLDLLRRYFAQQAELGPLLPTDVSPDELRQVMASLNLSAVWQGAWRELEEEFGLSVTYPTYAFQPPSRLTLVHRRYILAAAAVAVLALTTILLLARPSSPHADWALLDTYPEQSRFRSPTDTNYFALGREALYAAQPTFQLFGTRFDKEQAAQGNSFLERAFEEAESPFDRSEIAFFLAKGYLMQDNPEAARRWIMRALTQNIATETTYYGPELERLQQRYSADG